MSAFLMLEEAFLDEKRQRRLYLRPKFRLASIPDIEFIGNYKTQELFQDLCEDKVPLLPQQLQRNDVDSRLKILAALNFYARGSYQGAVGLSSDVSMAQRTMLRCLRDITNALKSPAIAQKYIKFPQNLAERNLIKEQSYEKYRLLGVVGYIDCTHVHWWEPLNMRSVS